MKRRPATHGQLFAIDAQLQTVAWGCPLDASPCTRFYVDGLPGVAVTWNRGPLASSDDSAGVPGIASPARLIVTPRHGRLQPSVGYLELVGVLDGDLGRPVSIGDLADTGIAPDPMRLQPVNGWLVVDGPMFCALQRPGQSTPCPPARSAVTTDAPDGNGGLGTAPVIGTTTEKGAPGIGPLPMREPGPFLVRRIQTGPCRSDAAAACATTNGCSADGTPGSSCAADPSLGWVVAARYAANAVPVVTFP